MDKCRLDFTLSMHGHPLESFDGKIIRSSLLSRGSAAN